MEYNLQYGELDALAMIVEALAMGGITDSSKMGLGPPVEIKFFSAFHLSRDFSKQWKIRKKGNLLFVGASLTLEGMLHSVK